MIVCGVCGAELAPWEAEAHRLTPHDEADLAPLRARVDELAGPLTLVALFHLVTDR